MAWGIVASKLAPLGPPWDSGFLAASLDSPRLIAGHWLSTVSRRRPGARQPACQSQPDLGASFDPFDPLTMSV